MHCLAGQSQRGLSKVSEQCQFVHQDAQLHPFDPHTSNQFGDFVVNTWIRCFVQRFCHSNTLLPQQFGVSRWSRVWFTPSMYTTHTHSAFHYCTQKAPAPLFNLSRLAFGRLPALKECRGLLLYWMLVSVVPLHTLSFLSYNLFYQRHT